MIQLGETKNLTRKLVVVAGPDAGREIMLDDGATRWTVGRGADMDARIRDPYTSRRHFTLKIGTDGVFITDMGSKGGTLVGGVKVSQRQLRHGARSRSAAAICDSSQISGRKQLAGAVHSKAVMTCCWSMKAWTPLSARRWGISSLIASHTLVAQAGCFSDRIKNTLVQS